MVTIGESTGRVYGGSGEVTPPETPYGSVCPSPVRYSTTGSPGLAGLLRELRDMSGLRKAPGPLPLESAVNSPGAAAACPSEMTFELWPEYFTSSVTFCRKT